ncbi:MAG TPA: phosphoglycolate phosphatase [Gammaproteobacteria bacterium]|nr:phosphoglycolate phosphatase [Gammaproteobacteria bacterium]
MSDAPPLHGVLFDLDGTLLDTAPDLAAALNRTRADYGLPALPYAAIRPWVSHGSYALTRLGFDFAETSAEFEAARRALLDHYHAHLAEGTTPFPGMRALLAELEARGVAWGIVTNKPGWLTEPLLARLGLDWCPACVVSGDTLPERKPHPAPLLHAAQLLGCAPACCVYVGDAERDVAAGRAAGMRTLVAAYGYLAPHDEPARWQAHAILDSPQALARWLAASLDGA